MAATAVPARPAATAHPAASVSIPVLAGPTGETGAMAVTVAPARQLLPGQA